MMKVRAKATAIRINGTNSCTEVIADEIYEELPELKADWRALC